MEQNKTRVDYTITIKGSDGSEEEIKAQSFILCHTSNQSNKIDCQRIIQATIIELTALYAALIQQQKDIEKIDKLIPLLYQAGELFEKNPTGGAV